MPAYHLTRAADATERTTNVPRATVVIGVLIIGLCFVIAAGTAWPSVPNGGSPAPTVTITPDDPAAPTVTPAQLLGR